MQADEKKTDQEKVNGNPYFVENDIDFECSACKRPVRRYHIYPIGTKSDANMIVFHKLCQVCFTNETGGGVA